jgi:hypothetical protein
MPEQTVSILGTMLEPGSMFLILAEWTVHASNKLVLTEGK